MDYDVVIVGAGSAGCVLANRLSAAPARRVLLLEAGPRDLDPYIHMPAGLAHLPLHRRINWNYATEPEPALENRRLWWPRGRVLGGSSSINAMCYVRGVPGDYDRWAVASGDPRWSWTQVLPYFLRSEDNTRGASVLHGVGGPLGVGDLRHHHALSDAFVAAGAAAGFARNEDFNGPTQDGFGLYQVTQRDGWRCSTARGFLAPARGRGNLAVHTGARVERVLLAGDRAQGVRYRRHGHVQEVQAGEVILCGGAINSPQLLMLSGIGPADALRALALPVHADLPGVGGNLSDHLDLCTLVGCTRPITYDVLSEWRAGLRFLLRRDGPASSNIAEAGGFVRSALAEDERCDVQFHFVPALLDDHGRHRLPGCGYTVHACGLHPRSRGRIVLRSADPAAAPAIHANYLGDPEGRDLQVMIEAAKLSRELLAQAPFDAYRGAPVLPERELRDDAEIAGFIRRKAETVYHPVGSCRMGRADDAGAVVDSELRVRGITGLRVVDASVMPALPSGNTNAPTIMIAERAADMIAA